VVNTKVVLIALVETCGEVAIFFRMSYLHDV